MEVRICCSVVSLGPSESHKRVLKFQHDNDKQRVMIRERRVGLFTAGSGTF